MALTSSSDAPISWNACWTRPKLLAAFWRSSSWKKTWSVVISKEWTHQHISMQRDVKVLQVSLPSGELAEDFIVCIFSCYPNIFFEASILFTLFLVLPRCFFCCLYVLSFEYLVFHQTLNGIQRCQKFTITTWTKGTHCLRMTNTITKCTLFV